MESMCAGASSIVNTASITAIIVITMITTRTG
jgi:hypothetical protein